MGERPAIADVERLLVALGAELLPAPPATLTGAAVTADIRARRRVLGMARPPSRGLAGWPRRRVVVLIAAALLLLTATIAATRLFVVGGVEIRVVPAVSPPTAAPPSLGPPVSLGEAGSMVGFVITLPADLGSPEEVHVLGTTFARRVVLLGWRPGPGLPSVGGTPWGAMLMELPSREGVLAIKDLAGQNPLERVRVGEAQGYWIEGAHDLTLVTGEGEVHWYVRGNVLLWDAGGVTYRLETALGRAGALRLAASVP